MKYNRVNAKGQYVIPADLRKKYGIKNGTQLIALDENGKILLMPMEGFINSLQGLLKGGKYTLQDFLRERRQDRY